MVKELSSRYMDSDLKRNLVLLWFGQFVVMLGLTGITPIMYLFMEDFGISVNESLVWSGLTLAAPAMAYAISTPFWGRMGDKWNRKWMVTRALICLALCMIGMALAPTPQLFFVFRLLQGALGGIHDASTAYLASMVPKQVQGEILGKYQTAVSAGALVGPLLGGVCFALFNGTVYLLLIGCLVLVAAVASAIGLTSMNDERRGAVHKPNGIMKAYKDLILNIETRSFIILGILYKCAIFGVLSIYVLFIRDQFQLGSGTATWVGILEALVALGSLIGVVWWGKQSSRRALEVTFCIASLGCGLALIFQVLFSSLLMIILLRFIQGFCFSALMPIVLLSVIRTATNESRGIRIGTSNSLLMSGQMMGSLLSMVMIQYISVSHLMTLFGGVLIAGGIYIYLQFRWKHEKERSVQWNHEH
jgi:MFS family permease